MRFTYDKMGNTTVLTTPGSVAHDFEYNAVGRNSAYDTLLSAPTSSAMTATAG